MRVVIEVSLGVAGGRTTVDVVEGVDQEDGTRWVVVFVLVSMAGPGPANDNLATVDAA